RRHSSRLCFSSRRRHTRSKRDWSSDVCSSDLLIIFILPFSSFCSVFSPAPSLCTPYFNYPNTKYSALQSPKHTILYFQNKSHIKIGERRVGKECMSRGSRAR